MRYLWVWCICTHKTLCTVILRLYCLFPHMLCYIYLTLTNLQQNVLVDDSGKALLCDFGLARLKADITTRTTETDAVAMAGSRHWMAPERLRGRALRKPCDIYSFGITSYEVISGSKKYIIVLNVFTRFMSMMPRSVMLVMPKSAISLCANKPSQNDRTRMRLLS
jgi:serine/threonine protein kinase